jgi:inosose dehydratase
MIDRRSFLASTACLAGSALLGAHEENNPFSGLTVGIQTYTFRKFNLEQTLKRMQDLGLKYGEFYRGHIPTDSNAEKVTAYKKLCGEYGVTPIAFGVEKFTKDHDHNKRLFEFAAGLGAKHLTADPDPGSFESLDKLVDEYKISIAIHPHGPVGKEMHRWKSAEYILSVVKDHHELIGTCLDTGHIIRSAQLGVELDSAKEVAVMGARNFGMHLKDHDNKRKTDVIFGDKTGVLDVLAVLKALKAAKFKGYIAVEYEANEANPTEDVKACLEYLKEQAKKS